MILKGEKPAESGCEMWGPITDLLEINSDNDTHNEKRQVRAVPSAISMPSDPATCDQCYTNFVFQTERPWFLSNTRRGMGTSTPNPR